MALAEKGMCLWFLMSPGLTGAEFDWRGLGFAVH